MPLDATLPYPAPRPSPPPDPADRLQQHQDLLEEMIGIGADRIRLAHQLEQARIRAELARLDADPASPSLFTPADELASATAYERRCAALRKGMLLARRLAEPVAAHESRSAARQRIRRTLEDEIQREWVGDTAETLREEVLDRLDSPEMEDEIGIRPTEEIIAEIRRDLPLGAPPGAKRPWCRRTPEDIAELHAFASKPPQPAPDPRPAKPRAVWPQDSANQTALPADPEEAVAFLLRGGRLPAD